MISQIKKSLFKGDMMIHAPLGNRTTFKTGGSADLLLIPYDYESIVYIRQLCLENDIPLFILGGGSNVLISDRGVRGITLSLESFQDIKREDKALIAQAGVTVNSLVNFARDCRLAGLEFLNRLPGTLGGAIYMNARCYGSEISQKIDWVEYIDTDNRIIRKNGRDLLWDYKKSSFQKDHTIILRAQFILERGDEGRIDMIMKEIANDRIAKGHFNAPCAGSTFKNNRTFGVPSGKIIDDCHLKGHTLGGAQVSPWHGNIIINRNKASAQELSDLIDYVKETVYIKTGFQLEPEVIRVGEWE